MLRVISGLRPANSSDSSGSAKRYRSGERYCETRAQCAAEDSAGRISPLCCCDPSVMLRIEQDAIGPELYTLPSGGPGAVANIKLGDLDLPLEDRVEAIAAQSERRARLALT